MKKIDVDVVVAGAGVAGVTSAVSVGEKGYSVALFEFSDGFGNAVIPFGSPSAKPGGAPLLGGVNGIFAVETEFQNARHHVTTKKEVYNYLLEHAHWYVDPRIIADFVNRSTEVYDWLVTGGLKIETVVSYYKDAPFTGLYAAGGCCSLLNGELYTHRIAGSRATYALVSGRILGESIPDYLK